MKRYPAYKDSGLAWLGEIPEHWCEYRSKGVFKEVDNRSEDGKEELLSVSHYTGVTPRSEKNINMIMAESYEGFKLCLPSDLVINIMWAWMGALGVAFRKGIVSSSYVVYRICNSNDYDPKYIDYLLRIRGYIYEYTKRSKGIHSSRWRLYSESFFEILIVSPPKEEQEAIVKYLDCKLEKIDRFISNKQKLIALFKEQKMVMINRAVTRGIKSDVKLKPSGIDWIGDIPIHWRVKKLKYIAGYVIRGNSPSYVENSSIKVINQACIQFSGLDFTKVKYHKEGNISLYKGKIKTNDILVNSTGTGTLGRSCIFYTSDRNNYLADGHVTIIRHLKGGYNPHYLQYFLSTRQDWITVLASDGATNQIELQREKFRSLFFPFPSVIEQNTIVKFIQEGATIIDKAISKAQREIELIKEYRTTLISDAVTGKIDVRDTAKEGVSA